MNTLSAAQIDRAGKITASPDSLSNVIEQTRSNAETLETRLANLLQRIQPTPEKDYNQAGQAVPTAPSGILNNAQMGRNSVTRCMDYLARIDDLIS